MEYNGYKIMPLGTFSMYSIGPVKSGQIPSVLKGNYTSLSLAQKAIDVYLSTLITNKKGKVNGQKESTSTG